MRELLAISCESEWLGATLDRAGGSLGVVMVIGGGQTRIGAHRGFAQLSGAVAEAGYPCLRFDRRGVGDSSGEDPGFENTLPEIRAAAAALREKCPAVRSVIGYGLCDGATALALHGAAAGLDGMILANPWVVEAQANDPPPAAIGKHYREQLMSLDGWKRMLTGGIDYRKAVRGVMKIVRKPKSEGAGSLAERTAAAMASGPLPAHIVLADDDATAIAFDHEWRKGAMQALSPEPRFTCDRIDTDAHSFAHDGNFERLRDSCLQALQRFEAR